MEKIKQFIGNVKCTFQKICDTIKNIKSEVAFYKALWDRPEGKAALGSVLGQLRYLLKKLRPSKIEGDLVFGTGDPALTGQVLGGIAAFCGVLPKKLHITPDFEEKRYEGTLYVKGKLRLIHLVMIAGKLLLDKNVRYAVKQLMDKEDGNHE